MLEKRGRSSLYITRIEREQGAQTHSRLKFTIYSHKKFKIFQQSDQMWLFIAKFWLFLTIFGYIWRITSGQYVFQGLKKNFFGLSIENFIGEKLKNKLKKCLVWEGVGDFSLPS